MRQLESRAIHLPLWRLVPFPSQLAPFALEGHVCENGHRPVRPSAFFRNRFSWPSRVLVDFRVGAYIHRQIFVGGHSVLGLRAPPDVAFLSLLLT